MHISRNLVDVLSLLYLQRYVFHIAVEDENAGVGSAGGLRFYIALEAAWAAGRILTSRPPVFQ